ncbi:hypothetical protein LTR08_006830 [Meristemomyces frigidus]|nr:hypothetical protein LTR08_006830 [Meristemomyces frigidus]
MRSFDTRYAALAASLIASVHALNGIVVPGTVAANTPFNATFQNGGSDSYRVYLSAALAGVNGPTCYLVHSTDLLSPVSITIPAAVGPSADYYSIGIADLTTKEGPTFSNLFNFTGGTGNYTEYEQHLGGAPFWDANSLPCSSYECARVCAQAGYPDDLSQGAAYKTMMSCILKCPGVSSAVTSSSSSSKLATTTKKADAALITLSSGAVLTAVEMTVTSGGSTMTEAVVGGSRTLTLGGAEATVSNEAVSLAQDGVEVGSSTTVPFSTMVQTMTTSAATGSASSSASLTEASAASASSGAASRHEMAIAGMVGVAGIAVFLL